AALGRPILLYPVNRDGMTIGVLIAADREGPDRTASSADIKLLGATASQTGMFLENAALYEDMDAMFLGTLEAITASIDAKDKYTCGHSQRVAQLSQQLATAIGLDEKTIRQIQIAGLVHDVGKIGVPESVLCKPGRLTEAEFDLIKQHPEIGHRILRDIPQLRYVLPGVLYHHERWDGRGYPHGIAGADIPLAARILALADSFDAMSSTRTYRSARDRTWVLEEITRSSGTQFDPELAPVFVGLDFTEFDQLVVEHRADQASAHGEAA
ncbi:MAG: HD domain-containing phosphohydrolase, partial [Phycisphaerales bacterium]